MKSTYKVVILASGTDVETGSRHVKRLIARINAEVSDVIVCGLLYEVSAATPRRRRIIPFLRRLTEPGFFGYVTTRVAEPLRRLIARAGSALLRMVHAMPRPREPAHRGDIRASCHTLGCPLLVTDNINAAASRTFLDGLGADLGILYGTRIIEPAVFQIPREGCVNVHKHKLPDYRGDGPVGLWELLDDQNEIGITLHRVTAECNAGDIIAAVSIPIDPYDTLNSLSMKADMVGEDLIVNNLGRLAKGETTCTAQAGPSRLIHAPAPHRLRFLEHQLARSRPTYRPSRGRSAYKLLIRSLLGLPWLMGRNWYRRLTGTFPVIILFHHLVSDRPHRMGCSTDHFLRHIRFLKRHYRVVSLEQAMQLLKGGRICQPTAVITIDDGYQDNYLTLRAIRACTNIPTTLFLSTDYLGSQREFDHDLQFEQHGFLPLTWPQVAQMAREGFDIGSHTRTHFDCGSRDKSRLTREIENSKAILEQRLGIPITMFSFPFGYPANMSEEALAIAERTYRWVFSAWGGNNPPHSANTPSQPWLRCTHPNDLWELELTLQSILDFALTRKLDFNPALDGIRVVTEEG